MKLYIKRNDFRVFEKGAILFDNSDEWSHLKFGLEDSIRIYNENLEFYNKMLNKDVYNNEQKEEFLESIKTYEKRIEFLEKLKEQIELKNEIDYSEIKL